MSKLIGRGGPDSLSPALRLDLQRLRKVVSGLGDRKLALRLFWHRNDPAEQLRLINHYLGERLAEASARERRAIAKLFPGGDDMLPAEIRSVAGTPPEANLMLDAGCAALGKTMPDNDVEAIIADLRTKPVLLGHVPDAATGQAESIHLVGPESNYACYDFLDLWSSPGLVRFAAQDRFIDLAQAYLGCTPTLYSINAFWSFPKRAPHKASQVFHRDWEDYRSLALFTQLTPVDVPEDGAHYYVETSNDVARFERTLTGRGIASNEIEALSIRDETVIAPLAMKLFRDNAHRFDGPAGQSFCTDGYGLHRAEVPRDRPRLLLWLRFGSFFNDTLYTMKIGKWNAAAASRVLASIPGTPRHQYVFRYMIHALTAGLQHRPEVNSMRSVAG
ncbi:MAG: hypothetical protein KIS73_05615 [Enhydrobacter sp.]|nr:hypothetical protein [Enhydrobacter sp.]